MIVGSYTVANDDLRWYAMIDDDRWLNTVVEDGMWWYVVRSDGGWLYAMIDYDRWWYPVISLSISIIHY